MWPLTSESSQVVFPGLFQPEAFATCFEGFKQVSFFGIDS